jgi:hypothetical protein
MKGVAFLSALVVADYIFSERKTRQLILLMYLKIRES